MNRSYQLLDAMGIPYWIPKIQTFSPLVSEAPLWCAACLVLLPQKISKAEREQNQILSGMLNVLGLNEDELCVAWVGEGIKPSEFYLLRQEIIKWAPYSLLIMEEKFSNHLLSMDGSMDDLRTNFHSLPNLEAVIQVTYHPTELQKQKELKRKAYEDLLRLKAHLSLVRAS